MESILIGIEVLVSITIIALVLMQQGKGADAGASFGGGASQTMFGSSGSGNFLTRATSWAAVVFFATSLGLAIVAKQKAEVGVDEGSVISGDLEQIILEQEQQRARELDFPEIPAEAGGDELPAVDAGADEFPAIESAVEDAQAGLEQAAEEAEQAVSELPDTE